MDLQQSKIMIYFSLNNLKGTSHVIYMYIIFLCWHIFFQIHEHIFQLFMPIWVL